MTTETEGAVRMETIKTWIPMINMITTILVLMAMGIMSYMIGQIGDLRTEIRGVQEHIQENAMDLVEIKANRFTSADAIGFMNKISDRLSAMDHELSARLNTIQSSLAKLPTEVPPQWFIDRVDANARAIEKLKERMQ